MTEIALRSEGLLAGRTIAILMESDYVEPEVSYYERRFAEEGARTVLLTRLWGQPSLTFQGHEYQVPITVDGDLEAVDEQRLRDFDALIVPGGMVSDRLRYAEKPGDLSPAAKMLRASFDEPSVLKGIICHGMWLVSLMPELIRGRRVTCHNNLVGDILNMGGLYTDQDVVVDGDLVTGRSSGHCHLFARMIIDLIAARHGRRPAVASRPFPAASPVADRAADPVADPKQSLVRETPAISGGESAARSRSRLDFPFSDLVAGYVTRYDPDEQVIDLQTSDGRGASVRLTDTTYAEFARNLGDPYRDATAHVTDLLTPGHHVFAHGIYYPEDGEYTFEAKRLVFSGRRTDEYSFEAPDWWVRQIQDLGNFYRRAQFGESGVPDFAMYRTVLGLGGEKTDQYVQETDTISRLVYGMSSAYMLTGDDQFLEVAERGTDYLRQHMRFVDRDEDVTYWYHGIDVRGGAERKLFTSEFGDDYDAIPMYEQLYALGGLTQLYRVTGDPSIATDIEGTLRLFRKFYYDTEHGGYFSHLDPVQLSPHHESLGPNRARKNWNSIGDHAPAYLINLYLATGEERHAQMLEDTYDLVAEHMPDAGSPFVQERFHADWSPDRNWLWQQDRAVVGHNLKIAWNLMRIMAVKPKERYRELAERIARSMPAFGNDRQRGGWYDVMERTLAPGQSAHRFTWHDRKAWWQQEQAILAYQILAGLTEDSEFLRQAREAAAFYNAFFLDHDGGGVYFNVLADGTPYLLGNERLKGSHSMSMCHAAELCYLATVYQRLLVSREPLTLWFRPRPDGFADRILRTAPDALPAGRVRLDWVEVDGSPYPAFDPNALTVKLPDSNSAVTVRAHLSPAGG
ncbi:MAG: AGE family epimerase/isomerase [Streptosporangiaceae bacterium]|nr:AGE family epimerase/isomerase [Streptosporangiaceae bacterium]